MSNTNQTESPASKSAYALALQNYKNQSTHTLKSIQDQWRTPDWLYWGIASLFGDNGDFDIDLFTDGQNAKAERFYTVEDNALVQDWTADLNGGIGFGNPPYSRASKDHLGRDQTGMLAIMKKAQAERDKGARSVFLIKAATSETWWPQDVMPERPVSVDATGANAVIFIRGRIAFDVPLYFCPASEKDNGCGAGFSGAIAIFDKNCMLPPMSYISRKQLEAIGKERMARMAGERACA